MKIEGFHPNPAPLQRMSANEQAAIQKKIQSLKKELGELEKKDALSQEEAKKKQELKRQIAKWEQKLKQIKNEQTKEKPDSNKQPQEEGKGENVDELT